MNAQIQIGQKRCAIYTRKSFDPPFGQEVTSLESQRSICSAYIVSQQHKGWSELAKRYDDPGRTGANLVRPALQDMMADIEAGLVDIVVVYKLDRITRTMLDFVRLIDFFDRYGVAFVSITQNFDTSDSMGRLIRNILLTFAQFEREIASDRMRDKKMVMKQRGLWTGGDAPIGYDLRKGKLIPNRSEALAVRCVFETYVETKSVSATHKRLIAEGHRRKSWKTQAGERKGGGPIALTSLHHVLRNPVYIGDLTYRGERNPGVHERIIDQPLWDAAQAVLKEREQFKPRQPRHLLHGVLVDAFGRRMKAHEVHGGPAHGRYYASAFATWAERQRIRPVRIRADAIEQIVLEALKRLASDRTRLRPVLARTGFHGLQIDQLSDAGGAAAIKLERLAIPQLSLALKALLQRVEVTSDRVFVTIRLNAFAEFILWDEIGLFTASDMQSGCETRIHVEEVPANLLRERRKGWLPVAPRTSGSTACPRLTKLMQEAREAQASIYANRDLSLSELAQSAKRKAASFSRLVRLNYLAPDIVAAIVDGTQPSTLSRQQLMDCELPMDWALQRRLLGFPAQQEAWNRKARE